METAYTTKDGLEVKTDLLLDAIKEESLDAIVSLDWLVV